jgi:hypothetical protein
MGNRTLLHAEAAAALTVMCAPVLAALPGSNPGGRGAQ